MFRVVTLFLAASLAGCVADRPHGSRGPAAGPSAVEAQRLRAEVLKELDRYYRDFSARNWEAFATHFWPGATITTIWAPPGEEQRRVVVSSVEDFIASAGEGPDSKAIFEERMGRAEVRAEGVLALVWAQYHARMGDPRQVSEWSGVDAFTLMKHEGLWKITSLAFAPE